MNSLTRRLITWCCVILLLASVQCADVQGPENPELQTTVLEGLIVSESQAAAMSAASVGVTQVSVTYVSLRSGTLPLAASVQIRNRTTGAPPTEQIPFIDGGFDPIAIEARVGDLLQLVVTLLNGNSETFTARVPPRRPPTIVRTNPPKGRTDVALSIRPTVIFSEPVDPTTLSATSVRLLQGNTPVSGTVGLEPGSAWSAEFTPASPLQPGKAYELNITRDVHGLDGDALDAAASITFTTATTTGGVNITVTTTGLDPDPNGYTVAVDGGGSNRIGLSGSTTITGIAVGEHSVLLDDLAPNCSVTGANPRTAIVVAGQITLVPFSVECVVLPPGTLRVRVVTTGSELDLDGYGFILRGPEFIGPILVGINEEVTIPSLKQGQYLFQLGGIAPTCAAIYATAFHVAVTRDTAVATIHIRCGPDERLAYVDDTEGDIYIIQSNGSFPTRITYHPAPDFDPAWSPDRSKIAFVSNRDGNYEIYVMNADGTNVIRLTNNSDDDSDPAWSPDGRRIAFVRFADLYVMNANGTNPQRLTEGPAIDADPAWSPDGRKIAFSSSRSSHADIHIMNSDGSGVVRLTFTMVSIYGDRAAQPAWSPDGTQIAFGLARCFSFGCYHLIGLVNADGSNMTTPTAHAVTPTWSPDGSRIAYHEIVCIPLDDYATEMTCTRYGLGIVTKDRRYWTRLTTNVSHSGVAWR